MTRLTTLAAFAIALICTSIPVLAQDGRHAYVQGVSGFGISTGSMVGIAVGVDVAPSVRIGGEVGHLADLTPTPVRAQFNDPDLAALGATVTPHSPAFYALVSGTYLGQPARRVHPYVGGGLGFARLTRQLEIMGSSPTAQMIRDDYAGNSQSALRVLANAQAGVNVPLHSGIAVNLGYRFTKVFDDSSPAPLTGGGVEAGLTFGF